MLFYVKDDNMIFDMAQIKGDNLSNEVFNNYDLKISIENGVAVGKMNWVVLLKLEDYKMVK